MEADAERIGRLASGEQQAGQFARFRAELRGEAELGMFGPDADADEQVEVGRSRGSRAMIFSSSSIVSRLKVFTPWSK